ncbi:MAG: amino acid ABC transporter permease [Phormidesmis sp.]
MAKTSSKPVSGLRSLLRDERFWQIALQVMVLAGVIAAFSYLFGNLSNNLERGFGFRFLNNPAGFAMGENLLDYRPQEAYSKIIQAGIVNSFRVIVLGVLLATIVGITAGVASFSTNWLVHKISRVYVGLIRNIPLLLQLIFWYSAVFLAAPREANQALLPSENNVWVILSNKGLNLPGPSLPDEVWVGMTLLALSLLLIGVLWRSVNNFRRGRFAAGLAGWLARLGNAAIIVFVLLAAAVLLLNPSTTNGLYFKGALISLFTNYEGLLVVALIGCGFAAALIWQVRTKAMLERGEDGKLLLAVLIAIAVTALLILLFAFNWQTPTVLESGKASGGMRVSMEYAAVVTALTFYTGAFIAEIVRAGVQSVSRGQWEAARSLGLDNGKAMRLVVFPQSLRVIIPPLNSEFANLAKNSSLAFAVGYPDLYNVANTTFNQTGRSIEVFLVIMATYLIINLLISVNMNQLNAAVQFKER